MCKCRAKLICFSYSKIQKQKQYKIKRTAGWHFPRVVTQNLVLVKFSC